MHSENHSFDRWQAAALALGWFSIALGAAELIAPGQVARLIGVSPNRRTCRMLWAYGARKMASGIGMLSRPSDPRWLWSRIGGDAIDLATLGQAARRQNTDQKRLGLATLAMLGVTAVDVLAAQLMRPADETFDGLGSVTEEQAITIKSPMEMVEAAWTRWSTSGLSTLKKNYALRFEPAPGARGTEVRLAGGGSKGTIREELRRFKQYVETGEIPVSDGPGLWRPAQPARDPQEAKNPVEVL